MKGIRPTMVDLGTGELILRVLAAALMGGLIGLEREFSDQPAGFRTHILVALGATLFTIVGAYGIGESFGDDAGFRFDPTRIAAQIVTGIGFLGAGAIIKDGITVRGLTTAASLWVTAAIGMAAGFGSWAAATTTTVAALLSLYGLREIEKRVFPLLVRSRSRLLLRVDPHFDIAALTSVVEEHGGRVTSLKFDKDRQGHHSVSLKMVLEDRARFPQLRKALEDVTGVKNADWRG